MMNEVPRCNTKMYNQLSGDGKTLVLDRSKWRKILGRLQPTADLNDQELQIRNQMRLESQAMTSQWDNTEAKIREKKLVEAYKKRLEKDRKSKLLFEKIKDEENKKHKESVERSKNLLEHEKAGPRSLNSAAILCEVLKGRQTQIAEHNELISKAKEQKTQESKELTLQANQWIADQQQKTLEALTRNNDYKRELLQYSTNKEHLRQENKHRRLQIEREQQRVTDQECLLKAEQDHIIRDRKKELLRQRAIEAVQLAEEKRKRLLQLEDLEDKIVSISNEKREALQNLKDAKTKEILLQNSIGRKIVGKSFANANDTTKIEMAKKENEIYLTARKEIDDKYTKLEQNKLAKQQALKEAKIHDRSLLMQHEAKDAYDREKIRSEMLIRLKNEEINHEFHRADQAKKIATAAYTRNIILAQIEANKKRSDNWRKHDNIASDSEQKNEDLIFFKHADKLIANAKANARPILPLIRTVENYKKHNYWKSTSELPHLVSQFNFDASKRCSPPKVRELSNSAVNKYDLDELKEMNNFKQN